MIKNAGYDPDNMPNDVIAPGTVKNMIELHIEQSVRLDKEGHTIGIISGIAGLNWITITLEGVQNHAGRDTNVPETGSNGRRIKDHC